MANSPAHRFGQIVGDLLERAVAPLLENFARRHNLYLDRKGPRELRDGKKCSWIDIYGNSHDLDFVLERGGTDTKLGVPVAFIEIAWRRYTKHSRAKAQEIQGAVLPIVDKHWKAGALKGAILAGVFTSGALQQLKSHGFKIAYFPNETLEPVFAQFGMDARWDESTPDVEVQAKIRQFEALTLTQRDELAQALVEANRGTVDTFLSALELVVLRQIERIVVIPLRGSTHELATVQEAIEFVVSFVHGDGSAPPVERYEIQIHYNNGDTIHGRFSDRESAVDFLRNYKPVA